jgi:hypothetical protein
VTPFVGTSYSSAANINSIPQQRVMVVNGNSRNSSMGQMTSTSNTVGSKGYAASQSVYAARSSSPAAQTDPLPSAFAASRPVTASALPPSVMGKINSKKLHSSTEFPGLPQPAGPQRVTVAMLRGNTPAKAPLSNWGAQEEAEPVLTAKGKKGKNKKVVLKWG